MFSPIKMWREALRAFPVFARRVVWFRLAFVLLSGAVLSPALAWLLEQLIRSTGDYAISNYDLVSFFLSVKGVLFLALGASTASALLYLEFTGLLLICASQDRPASSLTVLQHSLHRLPRLLRLGFLQAIALTAAASPFLVGLLIVKSTFLSAYDINYYLQEKPPEWNRAVVVATLLVVPGTITLVALLLRWFFAVPFLLNSDVGAGAAMRLSWRATRGRLTRLAAVLGGWWLCASLVGAALVGAWTWGAGVTLNWAGLRLALVFLLVVLFLVILALLTFSISVVAQGVNAILTNRLFVEFVGQSLSVPDVAAARAPGPTSHPIRLVWLALLAGFVIMTGIGIHWMNKLDFNEKVAITAHRGSSHAAPENTLSALRQAIKDGADYAEIDVQRTRDGQVVLLHDGDFMRLSGDSRRLRDLTWEEARNIDIGSGFSPAFAGERLTTLADAIDLVRGNLRLNIELKYNRPDPGLVPAVVGLLREKDFVDQCVVTSLDHARLQEAKRLEPRLSIGLIVTRSVGNPARLPVEFLSVNTSAAQPGLLGRAHQEGKAVHVWTVNDAVTLNRMVEAGVDNVITDQPAEMRAILDERARLSPAEKLALLMRRRLVD